MKKFVTQLAQRTAVALLLLGAGALSTGSITFGSALAGNNGNKGGGNGGGNSGGNGGGKNGGNSGATRSGGQNNASANASKNGSDRGKLARELKGLNAANANPNALKNAAPGSMPGKLYSYQASYLSAASAQMAVTEAETELARLQNLTVEEIAAEFPDGGYDEAVVVADQTAVDARANFNESSIELNVSYTELTGGRALSPEALAELNRMLGL